MKEEAQSLVNLFWGMYTQTQDVYNESPVIKIDGRRMYFYQMLEEIFKEYKFSYNVGTDEWIIID